MIARLGNLLNLQISTDAHERLKLLFLSILFCIIIGGYTIIRTLKDSFFSNIVGAEYLGLAKMWSILILIPAILLFSMLVDVMRRYQLLYLYSFIYGVGCLGIAYFIGHPVIGLANTETSKFRVFGWFIYFFLEGMNPFLVSLAWSFSHSITNPEEAKVNYPLMVAASKTGGMITAGLACLLLWRTDGFGNLIYSDITNHQILLVTASILILLAPVVLYIFVHKVPNRFMHGYEAAYKVDRKQEVVKKKGLSNFLSDIFSGLTLLIRYPYALGIFGVMFFWEIVNVFLGVERIWIAQRAAATLSGKTAFLLMQDFWVHVVGIIITLIGTRTFLNTLGERRSLLLVPVATGILLICYFSMQSVTALSFVFVITRAINYAFAYPLRESLYIPTSKEIKFKSKTWIEAFGVKIAKGVGGFSSSLVKQIAKASEVMALASGVGLFSVVIGLWIITANLLGRRFEQAIDKNEVIGIE